MKKLITLCIALLMVFTLVGCSKKSGGEEAPADDKVAVTVTVWGP